MSDGPVLESVATVARLLEVLAVAPQPVGVTELARQLGTSKARVHRFLTALKRYGLVDQELATERYRLGWRLFQLGDLAAARFDLRRLAEPVLQHLRDRTGLSALLAVPFNGEAVVVAAADRIAGVAITIRPGHRPAPHGTAQGRIVLAWAAAADVTRLLDREELPAPTPHALADPAAIRARLALIRQRLWDDAPGEALPGINVLAAPLFGDGDALAGSIAVIGTCADVGSPPLPAQLAHLHGAAAALSRALGGTRYARDGITPPFDLRGSMLDRSS